MDAQASRSYDVLATNDGHTKQLSFKASKPIEEEEDIDIPFEDRNSYTKMDIKKNVFEKNDKSESINETINNNNNNNISHRDDNRGSHNHNHFERSGDEPKIKLKRCKHGRIIVKDLSKKKLSLHNQTPESISNKTNLISSNELNETAPSGLDNRKLPEPEQIGRDKFPNASQSQITNPYTHHKVDVIQKTIELPRSDESLLTPGSRSKRQRSTSKSSSEKQSVHRHSPGRSQFKSEYGSPSRSSSKSLSRNLSPHSRRSPRNSNRSRSPDMRRDRASSPTRCDRSIRSERIRDKGRNRPRETSRNRVYSSNRRSRSSRKSPTSPRRRRSHSRSVSSTRDNEIFRRHRNISRSPRRDYFSRDQSRNRDISPQSRSSRRYDSKYRRSKQSPFQDRQTRSDSVGHPGEIAISNDGHKSHEPQSLPSSLGELLSAAQQNQLQQQQQEKPQQLKRLLPTQLEPLVPNVATPSHNGSSQPQPSSSPMNEDSVSSDVYDPAGPIIPISPVDSPPLSPILESNYHNEILEQSTQAKPEPDTDSTGGLGEGDEIIPSSAVQLNQQEKYLQKLNRQERVVEEVKIALKPFYTDRTIDKDQYKDVLRRAVPKICHNKNGEINPIKIRSLVEAYVRKMKHQRH